MQLTCHQAGGDSGAIGHCALEVETSPHPQRVSEVAAHSRGVSFPLEPAGRLTVVQTVPQGWIPTLPDSQDSSECQKCLHYVSHMCTNPTLTTERLRGELRQSEGNPCGGSNLHEFVARKRWSRCVEAPLVLS